MGLDMYLYGCIYIGKYTDEEKFTQLCEITGNKNASHFYIDEEVLYLRKVNPIHKWIVENCQYWKDNCKKFHVTHKDIKILIKLCKQVLENPEKADKILPTLGGFFFGSVEYDEIYFNDIKYTYEKLNEILENDKYEHFLYQSSW